MPKRRSTTPERKYLLRWLGGSIAMGLAFVIYAATTFSQERDKIYSAQSRLLSIYSVFTELTFDDIDDMLERAAEPYFNGNADEKRLLEGIFLGRQKEDPLLHNFMLVDRGGDLIFAARSMEEERDFVQWHIDEENGATQAPNGARIAKPFVCADGKTWIVVFSRAFRDEKGETIGYALASFDLKVISQRLERLSLSDRSTAALLSPEGVILARSPEDDSHYGRIPPSFVEFREQNKRFGEGIIARTLEGDKALVSFAPIEAYNMIVVCSTPYSEILERNAPICGGLFVAWLLLTLLARTISRREFTEERIADINARQERIRLLGKIEESQLKRLEAERSKSDHERILIQQSKMAAMGEMIGAIAHQWRQPLNAIGLYVQDILDAHKFDELNEEYIKGSVEKTMWQLKFMSATINDFRNFFKPDKDKDVFDLSRVVHRAISLIAAQLKSYDISMVFEIPNEPLWCNGYENELGQAVLNLVTNAKDALLENRKKNRKIVVRLVRNGQKARLEVEDNGGGVPREVIDRIFEPYFTTKDIAKGTGIGLYMSKMIVEDNMKGAIGVYNAEAGACFYISLPIVREGTIY